MNMKRVYYSLRLWTILSAPKRTEYLRKKKVFKSIGDHVEIMDRKIPLYPNLISFHNNIRIGSKVSFLTHDSIHDIVNNTGPIDNERKAQEMVGCIEIMDNVYIGTGSLICSGVRIGPNAIVSAGSVITKDVPPDSVVSGNPAKVVGSYSLISRLRRGTQIYPEDMKPQMGNCVSQELETYLWNEFEKKRTKK